MRAPNPKTEPPARAGVPSASPQEPLPSSSPPSPSPFPVPVLTPDDKERIETWFEHDSRLTEVANQLGIGVLTLAAWAKQPHIKEALLDICEIARFRTETLRAEAEHASVNRLLSIVRYSNHEEVARRAAANILGQGLRPARTNRATSSHPHSPPPRDPSPTGRDPITLPRVPTPPIPPLPPTTPNTPAPSTPSHIPHSDSQISNLKSEIGPAPFPVPVPRPATPPFPVPVPRPAPPPCLSVSVPPCHLPSTPLQPTPAPSASPREPLPSPPFPVPVPVPPLPPARTNTRPP